jgi:hypothetical protein
MWIGMRPLLQGFPKILVRFVSADIGDHVKGAFLQEAVALVRNLAYKCRWYNKEKWVLR